MLRKFDNIIQKVILHLGRNLTVIVLMACMCVNVCDFSVMCSFNGSILVEFAIKFNSFKSRSDEVSAFNEPDAFNLLFTIPSVPVLVGTLW